MAVPSRIDEPQNAEPNGAAASIFWPPYLLRIVVLAALLSSLGFINQTVAVGQDDTPLFWAPAGISLGVLLRGGLRWWPGVVLGAVACLFFQIPGMQAVAPAAGVVLGNFVGVVVSAWLLRVVFFRVVSRFCC
jgi:integral membrane sensor domain MASE1